MGLFSKKKKDKGSKHPSLIVNDVRQETAESVSIGFQIRLRRVFDDFKPVSKMSVLDATKSVADLELDVQGSGGNIDGGLSIEWSSMKVDHPEQFLMNHKLPRESGACLILEFMVKPDASEEKVEHASHKLLTWIKSHFDKELKTNDSNVQNPL